MSQICSMYLSLDVDTGRWYSGYRQLNPDTDNINFDRLDRVYQYIDADGDPTWSTYFDEDGSNANEALDRLRAEARAFINMSMEFLGGMAYGISNTGDDE